MKGFAGLILSLCDLAEAEGRELRKNIKVTGAGCMLAGIGLLFIGAAFAFCLAALYKAIATLLHPALVFVILAFSSLVIGAAILWSAKKSLPPKSGRKADESSKKPAS